jgi:hypothetical protein
VETPEEKNSVLNKTATNLGSTIKGVDRYIDRYRQNIFARFPILFSFLVTFGIVSILYGFEGLIDTIPFLKDRPVLILLSGIIILFLTGTLYKKLSESAKTLK